jgi:periplasmic protein TonB
VEIIEEELTMFENSVVESRRKQHQRRSTLTLPVSIAFHLLAVSGAVLASVWQTAFPDHPPRQVELLHVSPLTPPMQAASPPPSSPLRSAPASGSQASASAAVEQPLRAAPLSVPESIPDLTGSSIAEPGQFTSGGGSGVAGAGRGTGDGSDGGTEIVEGPLRAGGGVRLPVVTRRIDPDYPRAAVAARISGTVILECIVDRQGRVREVSVARGTHPLLDQAAVEAVRQWLFRPGSLNGEPVDTIFHLTVRFDLPRR